MEWEGHRGSKDLSAVPHVCAEVWAAGIVQVGDSVRIAPEHDVANEVEERAYRTGFNICRPTNLEPPDGNAEATHLDLF